MTHQLDADDEGYVLSGWSLLQILGEMFIFAAVLVGLVFLVGVLV